MPKYYAVYRIFFLCGYGCPSNYFDVDHRTVPEPGENGETVSLAYDLGNLTDSQLESLLLLVGKRYRIRLSEDWNADQKEHGIILLVKVSDSKNLNVVDNINQKRMRNTLKQMQARYEHAIENSGIDVGKLVPLAYCIEVAGNIRKPQSVERKRGVKAKTFAKKLEDYLYKYPEKNDWSAKELAIKLQCSPSSIKGSPAWKKIMRYREGARNAHLNKDETGDQINYDAIDDNLDQANDF